MLKQKSLQHKRKNSQIQLFYPTHNHNAKFNSVQSKPFNLNHKNTHSNNKYTQLNDKYTQSNDKNDKLTKHSLNINLNNKNNSQNLNPNILSSSRINQSKDKQTKQSKNKQKANKQKCNINNNKQRIIQEKQKQQNLKQKSLILKLVTNSSNRIKQKNIVIQDINENQNNQNYDNNNYCSVANVQNDQIAYDPFFHFGKRSRKQLIDIENFSPYNPLNMEEIVEVPDTMSNQRRYDTTSYQCFRPSNQNTLMSFSKRLDDKYQEINDQETNEETLQPLKSLSKIINKSSTQPPKTYKQRKNKASKIIQKEKDMKFDFSEFMQNQKKLINVNKNKQILRQKSKETLKKQVKSKSKASLLSSSYNKSKNFSQAILNKQKKSLSLKNKNRENVNLVSNESQKAKPKSFEKVKQHSSHSKINYFKPIFGKNTDISKKIMIIEESQTKLQDQYKVLWQCVGQLWQNSRIIRYISEKNKGEILKLKQNEDKLDEKFIKLKNQIITSISSARY